MTLTRAVALRAAPLRFTVDGRPATGEPGQSVASALLAAGIVRLRRSPRAGGARGAFCLMGICQECIVRIDGALVQACLAPVRDGMVVDLGQGSLGEGSP